MASDEELKVMAAAFALYDGRVKGVYVKVEKKGLWSGVERL